MAMRAMPRGDLPSFHSMHITFLSNFRSHIAVCTDTFACNRMRTKVSISAHNAKL